MTQAPQAVRDAVLATSLRAVAHEVGVSHQTLSDYLDEPDRATDKTAEKVRRWVQGRTNGGTVGQPTDPLRAELLRQVSAILDRDVPGPAVDKLEALAAVWRGYALAREADAAVARGYAVAEAEKASGRRGQHGPEAGRVLTPGESVTSPRGAERGRQRREGE